MEVITIKLYQDEKNFIFFKLSFSMMNISEKVYTHAYECNLFMHVYVYENVY